MTYAIEQDLIDRYGVDELVQLTDSDNLGVINTTAVTRALVDADGEIDSYLSSRYSAPLNPVPRVLTRVAADIARYHLYDDMASEQVTKRYNDAVQFLKGVARGDITIGVDAAGAKPTSNNTAQLESGGHVFGRKDDGFM